MLRIMVKRELESRKEYAQAPPRVILKERVKK